VRFKLVGIYNGKVVPNGKDNGIIIKFAQLVRSSRLVVYIWLGGYGC
jgi:hypothetical protein